MLKNAKIYEDLLRYKFHETWFDDKYKYYNADVFYSDLVIETDTWNKHQFVSVTESGKVVGYIAYSINRQTHSAHSLEIINFTDDKIRFGLDLGQALIDIFEKFRFNKLNFTVVIGNPIEKSYDKLIEKYGGRIIGVSRQNARLIDGLIYDEKLYEITSSEYFSKKEKE